MSARRFMSMLNLLESDAAMVLIFTASAGESASSGTSTAFPARAAACALAFANGTAPVRISAPRGTSTCCPSATALARSCPADPGCRVGAKNSFPTGFTRAANAFASARSGATEPDAIPTSNLTAVSPDSRVASAFTCVFS